MKLHLGCGQVYLEGYTNIDFPLSEHTVQQKSVADEYADLRELKYKKNSIDEVRLHHVFEHFPRHIAIALLASWQVWLKRGGKIMIEVPDFTETSKVVLGKYGERDKAVALRHIFGSNEAEWATHYEGWTEDNFKEILGAYGFKNIKFTKESYLATRNITVTARKGMFTLNKKSASKKAREYLHKFTVDESVFEKNLLNIWVNEFNQQTNKTM